MKKYFLILIVVVLNFGLKGQSEIREGYCITLQSDTLYGKFLVPVDVEEKMNLARLQWKVVFVDNEDKQHFYKPGDIESFYIQDSIEPLYFFTLEVYQNNFVFIRLITDGYMRLYVHYTEMLAGSWENVSFTNNFLTYPKRSGEDYFILQKSENDLIKIRQFSMYRKLSEYVSDYDELSLKIKKRRYKYTDIYRIVREYNEWYKNETRILTTMRDDTGTKQDVNN